MKLLYGTANPAKLKHMREMLDGLDLEIIGLKEINNQIDSIDESGNNPLENAKIKALAYYKATGLPVFSCDSGLYIAGISSEEQPGVQVRRVKGKTLNDEEMIEHYSNLASKLGGQAKAKYKNAICLVIDEENVFEYDGEDISSGPFIITSKSHPKRIKGFPIDSISLELETGKYYFDMDAESDFSLEGEMATGFREFFQRTIVKDLRV